jgi:hypothetical protein
VSARLFRQITRLGLRPEYDANYRGAFVFDLDGKIEAVIY